jgi:hypothetical protein
MCVCIPTDWEWLSFWSSRQQQFEKKKQQKNLAYSAEGRDGIIELYVATLFIRPVDFACLINTFPFYSHPPASPPTTYQPAHTVNQRLWQGSIRRSSTASSARWERENNYSVFFSRFPTSQKSAVCVPCLSSILLYLRQPGLTQQQEVGDFVCSLPLSELLISKLNSMCIDIAVLTGLFCFTI